MSRSSGQGGPQAAWREELDRHRRVWASKPALRAVYHDLYAQISAECVPGSVVEVGGGPGTLKEAMPRALSFDVVRVPWLDFVGDAQRLPLRSGSVPNLVLLDVLHHVARPRAFLEEAARVLTAGGRLVMIEPAITWLSAPFYRLLHHEPVRMDADPFGAGWPEGSDDPAEGNQAVPTLLVTRFRESLRAAVPEIELRRVTWTSLFCYPLSGGFQPWSLLPRSVVPRLLAVERRLAPAIGRIAAFRLLIVLAKRS